MSDTKYRFKLYIFTNPDKSEKDKPEEVLLAPIDSFEVEGGATRKIEINSTNDISLSAEFEQARMYKTITFYILPTKNFLGVKLMELRSPAVIKHFDFTFVVNTYFKGILSQTLRLQCFQAWFRKSPTPIGSTPPLLKAEAGFHADKVKLLHGKYDQTQKKLIEEEV